MAQSTMNIGDLVILRTEGLQNATGIISKPIRQDHPGHVLTLKDGYIIGFEVYVEDIIPADESTQGFAQLAYNLIKLGSHVIEKRLL